MHFIDWAILIGYLGYVVIDGIRRTRGHTGIEGYFLANRSLPWWAVGLSVMATQLSAVTMIGTTGQGATDGLRFVQFYFGLPLAMVILGVTLVPFLHGAQGVHRVRVPRAPLRREDALADGVPVPALARHVVRHDHRRARRRVLGDLRLADRVVAWRSWACRRCIYTMLGGVQAVTWADVKQMVLIVGALVAIVVVLLMRMPVIPDDGAARSPARRDGCRRSTSRSTSRRRTRSGRDSSAARS